MRTAARRPRKAMRRNVPLRRRSMCQYSSSPEPWSSINMDEFMGGASRYGGRAGRWASEARLRKTKDGGADGGIGGTNPPPPPRGIGQEKAPAPPLLKSVETSLDTF